MDGETLYDKLANLPPEQFDGAIEQIASQPYVCKQCGCDFAMLAGEIRYFLRMGLHLPKRCAECRKLPAASESTPDPMKGKFFAHPDPTRIPMVPWRHT